MLDDEALRQVGKLIADCDRRLLQYALTDEYLDALARAAATAVTGALFPGTPSSLRPCSGCSPGAGSDS